MKKQKTGIVEETASYTSKESELGVMPMPIITASGFKVTYHNPNTPEQVAQLLISLVAESMYNKIVDKK